MWSDCGGGSDDARGSALCALPNVLPRVVATATADESPIALQEGVTGAVTVLVTLDAHSAVERAVVENSPSVLLDASSTRAAQLSTYQTAIVNCEPVAASLTIVFRYPVVPLPPPTP